MCVATRGDHGHKQTGAIMGLNSHQEQATRFGFGSHSIWKALFSISNRLESALVALAKIAWVEFGNVTLEIINFL